METRLPLVQCPVQVLAPATDPHAFPVAGKVTAAIAGATMGDCRCHGAVSRSNARGFRRDGACLPCARLS